MQTQTHSRPLAVRGVHLDCRGPMLKFECMLAVFEDLARWGYNTVLLEYEDRFPYRGRPAEGSAPDALSAGQVRALETHAAGLGLRIVPLVHCLGHLEYVLRHPRHAALREGARDTVESTTACPSHPGSRALFREMAS